MIPILQWALVYGLFDINNGITRTEYNTRRPELAIAQSKKKQAGQCENDAFYDKVNDFLKYMDLKQASQLADPLDIPQNLSNPDAYLGLVYLRWF